MTGYAEDAKIRTFIAVEMPAEVRRALAEIADGLRESAADVKWVSEQNFHATLKFLGNVEASRVDAVAEAVTSAAEGIEPFEVVLAGVGAFPNVRRPNVVWVGVSSGAEQLRTLADRVDKRLERIGYAREQRPFSPHITIGRVKSPKNADRLRDLIEKTQDEQAGAFIAEAVTVMKSELLRAGPVYSPLARVDLLRRSPD